MSHHKDDAGQEHQDDLGVEQGGAGTERKGPETEQGQRPQDDAPQDDQVLDRDQISQHNDPNLKR